MRGALQSNYRLERPYRDMLGVQLVGQLPLPEGFARPRVEIAAAWLPGILLLVVSLVAAAWPATRAARIPVVMALRGGKL